MSDGLLIRVDHDEHVVRSVGDAPNGILCMVAPDGVASWAVDGSWTPQINPGPHGFTVEGLSTGDGLGPASTIVATAALVAGIESVETAQSIMQMMVACLLYAAQRYAPLLDFETLQSHAELAIRTRGALVDAGYLGRRA